MSRGPSGAAQRIAQFFIPFLGRSTTRSFAAGIVALAVCAAAPNGDAESPSDMPYYSGDALYRECTGEPHPWSRCLGYVASVANMLAAAVARGDVTIACMPADVTADQARDVVVNFLRDNPQSRHHSAVSLIELALADAFPCRW